MMTHREEARVAESREVLLNVQTDVKFDGGLLKAVIHGPETAIEEYGRGEKVSIDPAEATGPELAGFDQMHHSVVLS